MAISLERAPGDVCWPDLYAIHSESNINLRHTLQRFFNNRERHSSSSPMLSPTSMPEQEMLKFDHQSQQLHTEAHKESARKIGVDLPRAATLERQRSGKRYNLAAIKPCASERKVTSAQRRQRAKSAIHPRSKSSLCPPTAARITSAPPLPFANHSRAEHRQGTSFPDVTSGEDAGSASKGDLSVAANGHLPSDPSPINVDGPTKDERNQIESELDTKWILNLSMHFRDRSEREKFFITYAEEPNRWRRVTVSCDYRDAEPESLEADLKALRYQREKHAFVYEYIRDSIPTIEFFSSVTNLKLETEDHRLHVHVTEDVNEIIPFPPHSTVKHILTDQSRPVMEVCESDINFVSHLSGFVYKISFKGQEYIKKEIPGPDSVDEFLYEVNALHALSTSDCVIQLEAIVLDDTRKTVRGLLIAYAEHGAVVDLLYDSAGQLPLFDRLQWAQQAIQGLSHIHEEGFVQGDFTLSNIVVDRNNDAKIIDINRRGCPVGWEPPEFTEKIATNQRISLYIGQKSDLYQLGMSLWGLAMQDDEPERHDYPLCLEAMQGHVPEWFRLVVAHCLKPQPRDRWSARRLLDLFPANVEDAARDYLVTRDCNGRISGSTHEQSVISRATETKDEDDVRVGRPRRRSTSLAPAVPDVASTNYPAGSLDPKGSTLRDRSPLWDFVIPAKQDSGDESKAWCTTDLTHPITPNSPRLKDCSPANSAEYHGSERQGLPLAQPLTLSDLGPSGVVVKQSSNHSAAVAPSSQPSDKGIDVLNHCASGFEPDAQSLTTDFAQENASGEVVPDGTKTSKFQSHVDTADLAGCGQHPALEEYSPHEPRTTIESSMS